MGQAILRYIGYIVSALALSIGFIWIAIDKRRQGWHDKIARTYVIPARINRSRRWTAWRSRPLSRDQAHLGGRLDHPRLVRTRSARGGSVDTRPIRRQGAQEPPRRLADPLQSSS